MKNQRSLYSQLGYNNFIITLIPLLLLGIGFYLIAASSLNKTIVEKNKDIIKSMVRELSYILKENERDLDTIQSLYQSAEFSSESFENFLELTVENSEMLDMVQILNAENRIVSMAPMDKSLLLTDQSGHDFIKNSRLNSTYNWSKTFLSPENGKASVTLSKHYGDNLIVFYLNLSILNHLVLDSYSKEEDYAYILDETGTYIGHPKGEYVTQRVNIRNQPIVLDTIKALPGQVLLSTDGKNITIMQSLSRTGWMIGYRQDKDEAFLRIRYLRNIVLAGAIITCLVVLLFSISQIKKTAAPIRALLKAAESVTLGAYKFSKIEGQTREITGLANQFQLMTKAVETRETELNTLRQYLTDIIDSMPSFLAGLDEELQVTLWNKRAEEFTGYSRKEALGKELKELHPEFLPFKDPIVETITHQSIFFKKREKIEGPKGNQYVDITIYPLSFEQNKGAVLRMDDVTEQISMEKRVFQKEKLSSIGSMAAGMAHDFNNLLTPILGFSEMMQMEMDEQNTLFPYARQIYEAGEKARIIIGQLLSFSRQTPQEYSSIQLNEVIEDFMTLLRRTIREDIDIQLKLDNRTTLIRGDKGQLEQIIMNLALNSQFAMPDGGRITIKTEQRYFNDDEAFGVMKAGLYNVLALEDTGIGIDQETQKHIFEPFYTTKGNKGSGLGLATIYGIVHQHGGYLWLYSEPGMGTIFKVSFPALERSDSEEDREITTHSKLHQGTETILIAEDNSQVRELARSILENTGYETLEAQNGAEALTKIESCKEKNKPIHLLLTDLIMPEMNGKELFGEAKKIIPTIKVVFMSGYSDLILEQDVTDGSPLPFVQKPFNLSLLCGKIREVLDG